MQLDAIRRGDRKALATAITLLESEQPAHQDAAEKLLRAAAPHAGDSLRLGITGAPGAGKSTLIESLGGEIIKHGHRVAVLTVDPSSPTGGGSLLGDKTRMQSLSQSPQAFIRPSPSRGALGGVARRTRDAMLLCEAANYDVIVVETVGVGQSEVRVSQMTDIFILLLLPAAGDEVQGIKRGVMELADMVLINKADGELKPHAEQAASSARAALGLTPAKIPARQTPVLPVSALHNNGIDEVWRAIEASRAALLQNDALQTRRAEQERARLRAETGDYLLQMLGEDSQLKKTFAELEREVVEKHLPASIAARQLAREFLRAKG